MKRCWLVYYHDRTANVVICEDVHEIRSKVGDDKFWNIVKIELIPFDVL